MKQILFTLAIFFVVNSNAYAQAKTMCSAIIKVPGLHCDLDKDKIERYLFKSDGITKIKVDLKKKTVAVTWITDRTNLEQIKYDIANTGYDADNVTAEEDARKRLPVGCRVVVITAPEPAKKETVEAVIAPKIEPLKATEVKPVEKPKGIKVQPTKIKAK
jgi:periplasmic mercuric ion binding protein